MLRRAVWVTCFLVSGVAQGADWTQFRGPTAQGHSTETNLPTRWSETENIAWKVELPGRGWSSPVLEGSQIWLTTATEEDKSLRVLCLERETGEVKHNIELFKLETASKIHSKNTPSSPTPIIEGDFIYVHFGKLGTACLKRTGEIVWRNNKMEFDHRHGPGGSPVLYQDLLIFNCDGRDVQFIVALDKKTGEQRWRAERDGKMAFSTPLLIQVEGKDQLVSTCGEWVYAYEPASGKELWKSRYPEGYSNVPRPVFGLGLVFVCSGYNTPKLYAIRPNGQGDVTETHVSWKIEKGAPLNPSPLLVDDRLYMVSDQGILSCLNALSGEELWRQRLGGNYSASLVYAGGNIYAQSETGTTTVFERGDAYKEVSVNQLEGRTLATLSPSKGAIYLRTDKYLYRIQNK